MKKAAAEDIITSRDMADAVRPLRLLVVASLLFPIVIFAIAAWIGYRQQFEEATVRLERTLDVVYEHATKVFETFDLAARYTDEIVNLPDSDIRGREREFSQRLRILTNSMPQLLDIWVIGADGKLLVSGTVFPMPDLDLSNREYFSVLKKNSNLLIYVSELLDSRVQDLRFFAYNKRRTTRDGAPGFNGLTTISARPDYFSRFYATLPRHDVDVVQLIRADGALLTRFPAIAQIPKHLPEESDLVPTMKADNSGLIQTVSPLDGKERIYAYRRLANIDVFAMVGLDRETVITDWLMNMSRYLIFGVPATIALFILSLIALRRTRNAALALARLKQEVARRERTELALRQSQKMEAVGRLTGGIAHDFNNLLTAILGNVDLALRRAPENDERLKRTLNSARLASQRAATLIQRLLAYSRQHPLEVKSVDLNRLVQGMSELLRRSIGESITVETVLAGGLWRTAIDPNQLENAILNLAINARDAMPDGGRLTIETANTYLDEAYSAAQGGEVEPGQYVMLALTDSGTGMTKEIVDRAFEPFFTTKPTGVGTGLGLSMVYGFIKQSGGHIKIYSEIDEGTTIKLYLPRLMDETNVEPWLPPEAEQTDAPADDLRETILLVEDDEEVNRFATEVLREEGYNVISTHEGSSALRLFDANPHIKMLFTDVVLPGGMNGRQIADEARRRRPDLKVLFATGYTRNAIIHQGRLDADVDLLTKPFTPDDLIKKVRQILDTDSKDPIARASAIIEKIMEAPQNSDDGA
ncbi:MAG: ATP-binding protein [Pseudorhodoplanes sp.]|jgi:two-component system NtrC family sensor kinase|nr:ATP-binding protein [Pseudorhodoplanes sp.]